MKDSIRITKTKGGGVRIRASGKAADKLFRLLAEPPKPPVLVECPDCDGQGRISRPCRLGTTLATCNDCDGAGSIPQSGTVKEGT